MALADNLKGKKGLIFIGGGALALAGLLYWRHKQATAAAAGTPTDTTGDSTGYDPSSLDSGYGGYGFGGGGGGYWSSGGGGGTTGSGPGSFTNNAQWAQYAEQQLSGVVSETALSAALGKYLTGQPMNDSQKSLADQARAIAGDPPVSGPGGFPPAMHTIGGGGGGQGGHATNPVAGLHVTSRGFTSLQVAWRASRGATGYEVTAVEHGADLLVNTQHVTGTSARIGDLHRGARYDIKVRAQPGGAGGRDAHVTATTK